MPIIPGALAVGGGKIVVPFAAGAACHAGGGRTGLGGSCHAADAVAFAVGQIGGRIEQIPRRTDGCAAVKTLPCRIYQRKAVVSAVWAAPLAFPLLLCYNNETVCKKGEETPEAWTKKRRPPAPPT